jgi:hypothetical protein
MKPRPSALTSPAPCGAFVYPSASLFNRAAQAPFRCPAAAALPAALPLSPFGPVPPRLVNPKPLSPAALCLISQSPAARRMCRLARHGNPFAGTLPAPRRPGRAATAAAPPAA